MKPKKTKHPQEQPIHEGVGEEKHRVFGFILRIRMGVILDKARRDLPMAFPAGLLKAGRVYA
jgi:hypothetical protein